MRAHFRRPIAAGGIDRFPVRAAIPFGLVPIGDRRATVGKELHPPLGQHGSVGRKA